MKPPNFVIVGAPKCGTTALATYLGEHPQIFISKPKEPHFFAEDFPNHRYVTNWSEYLGLFAGAKDSDIAVGEASVFYLRSDVAVQRLMEKVPNARLVVMLRNPIELAQSMHAQALYNRNETVKDFPTAWRLRHARRVGQNIPKKCRDVKTLLYDEIARLGEQLKRLLDQVPRNQVRWWFYDDFAEDPGRVYVEVLRFLGVENNGRTFFPKVNARRLARSQLLAEISQKPPRRLVKVGLSIKAILGIERLGLLDALRRYNFVKGDKDDLDSGTWRDMIDEFKNDIVTLEQLTGRDLMSWLERPQLIG
jgi:hypothetical protein